VPKRRKLVRLGPGMFFSPSFLTFYKTNTFLFLFYSYDEETRQTRRREQTRLNGFAFVRAVVCYLSIVTFY
jgi:hypothetical protein